MADDPYLAEEMKKSTIWGRDRSQTVYDYALGGAAPLQLVK